MADRLISVDEFTSKRSHSKTGAVVKAFSAPPSWTADTRSPRFVMSSDTEDRDRDIVRQEGLDLTEFQRNPQALLFHSSRAFPIGKWSDVSKSLAGSVKTTEGTLNFLPEGADPDADRAARHVAFGTLRTVSIGFIPKTIRARERDADSFYSGYEILEATLLECSLVPIPSQPDALVKMAADDFVLARQLIEEVLDTYATTPDGLIVPRAEYERAYRSVTAAGAPRRKPKAVQPYDPDGDGDNDAQEALDLIEKAASHLAGAKNALSGSNDDHSEGDVPDADDDTGLPEGEPEPGGDTEWDRGRAATFLKMLKALFKPSPNKARTVEAPVAQAPVKASAEDIEAAMAAARAAVHRAEVTAARAD